MEGTFKRDTEARGRARVLGTLLSSPFYDVKIPQEANFLGRDLAPRTVVGKVWAITLEECQPPC